MTDLTITCPRCSTPIPLSEAVTHQIRERMVQDFEAQRQMQTRAFAEREQKLREQRMALEQEKATIDECVQRKLAEEKAGLLAEARRHIESRFTVELRDLQNQVTDTNRKLQQAQTAELEWRQQRRALEERQQVLELEVTRKLDAERAQIREEAFRIAAERERLKAAEKEKLITDLQHEIQRLQHKAEQGSVQFQGEVLELDLKARLEAQFPFDKIEEIAKGQRGADLLQRVLTNTGHPCGTILWEAKRAKNWTGAWIPKLKDDQRNANADLAILVTQTLPPEIRGFGLMDGVWVCDLNTFPAVALALRHGLVHAAGVRFAETGRQGKMEQLYQYLTGVEFRQRVEGVVEALRAMRDDLEAEKRALQKHWARREKQIEQAVRHSALLYGGVQGIAGQTAFPDLVPLQLPAGNPEPD